MTTVVFDIEANGLLKMVDRLWCVGVNSKVYGAFPGWESDIFTALDTADVLIGHNIIAYDLPVLKKLHNWDPKPHVQIIDTLILSRMLFPGLRDSHSLDSWGKTLNFAKGEIKDFSYFQHGMLAYCENDVKLTQKVYDVLQHRIKELKISDETIRTKMEFARVIALQVKSGFTLDVQKAEKLYIDLKEEYNVLTKDIADKFPLVKDLTQYNKVKSEGRLLNETEKDYTYITEKTKKVTTKVFQLKLPNLNSRKQLISWLKSKGWKPTTKTEKGTDKLDGSILSNIDIPEVQPLRRMFRVSKLLGMLKDGAEGWLKKVEADGRVRGEVMVNGAVTGRCTHARPNLAQVDKKESRMREVWLPGKHKVLVGVDAKSLEARVLAHYLFPYDKGAYGELVTKGDVHTFNQQMMSLNDRQNAKTINYAMAYGAGNRKLGITVAKDKGIDTSSDRKLISLGKAVRESVMDNFTGYKQFSNTVKSTLDERKYLISLSGRPLYPKKKFSALNTLIQAGATDIMEKALVDFHEATSDMCGKVYNYCCNVHDSIIIECNPEYAEFLKDRLTKCIQNVTIRYKLHCQMDADSSIGNNWSEVHA